MRSKSRTRTCARDYGAPTGCYISQGLISSRNVRRGWAASHSHASSVAFRRYCAMLRSAPRSARACCRKPTCRIASSRAVDVKHVNKASALLQRLRYEPVSTRYVKVFKEVAHAGAD